MEKRHAGVRCYAKHQDEIFPCGKKVELQNKAAVQEQAWVSETMFSDDVYYDCQFLLCLKVSNYSTNLALRS